MAFKTYFIHFSVFGIVDFEQIDISWSATFTQSLLFFWVLDPKLIVFLGLRPKAYCSIIDFEQGNVIWLATFIQILFLESKEPG